MTSSKIEGLADVYYKGEHVAIVDCDIYVAETDSGQLHYTGAITVATGGKEFEIGDKYYLMVHQDTGEKLNIFFPNPLPVTVSNTLQIGVAPQGTAK